MLKFRANIQAIRASVVGASRLPDVLGIRKTNVRIILKAIHHNRVKVIASLVYFVFRLAKVIARLVNICFRQSKVIDSLLLAPPSVTKVTTGLLWVLSILSKEVLRLWLVALNLQKVASSLMNVCLRQPKVNARHSIFGYVKNILTCSSN